jgi:hypothetical protein
VTPETVSLIAAIMFLLIAVVGGGFTAKELAIPRVPNWARAVSAVLGIVFIIPFMLNLDKPQPGPQQGQVATGPQKSEVTLYSYNQADISPEHLRLSGIRATSLHDPPKVGERITISFTLDNVAQKPFKLAYTFIAARDSINGKHDFGISNNDTEVAPGSRLTVSGSIIPDSDGRWTFWPCYAFKRNQKDMYCPSEWHLFPLSVQPGGTE